MQVVWPLQGPFVLSRFRKGHSARGRGVGFSVCLSVELILGFLGGNAPGYVSPQDGRE